MAPGLPGAFRRAPDIPLQTDEIEPALAKAGSHDERATLTPAVTIPLGGMDLE